MSKLGMAQTIPTGVTVCLALMMWGVSATSNWDYRFHRNISARNNEASSRANNGTSTSSQTLYSEGGEVAIQNMNIAASTQVNKTMDTSRTNSTQTTVAEGGGSDQVFYEDKTPISRKMMSRSEENVDLISNSTLRGDSVNIVREDSTALQTLSSMQQSSSRASQTPTKTDISQDVNSKREQQASTALAVVGRSLEEHHPETPGPRSDAVSSYYDFLVNEGSYKFWSVFQVFTAALLIYSAFAAVYYAKYTFATMDYPDYLDDGFFFRRSGADRAQGDEVYYDYEDDDIVTATPRPQQSTFLGMSSATFQRIMDALSSKKYS